MEEQRLTPEQTALAKEAFTVTTLRDFMGEEAYAAVQAELQQRTYQQVARIYQRLRPGKSYGLR